MKGKQVCRVHGGKSPSGLAHAGIKSGKYSKYLPGRLLERYLEARDDGELLALREEIAVIEARIADLLVRVDTGESGHIWRKLHDQTEMLKGALITRDVEKQNETINEMIRLIGRGRSDSAAWFDVLSSMEQLRKLKESERKRLVDMQQMITAQEATMLLIAVTDVIRKHISDRSVLSSISEDIRRLVADQSRRST